MKLHAPLQSFDLSDDEDTLVYASVGYDWDEEAEELHNVAAVTRLRVSTGEAVDLEALRLDEDNEPPAPWIRVSPSGTWTLLLTPLALRLYREAELVLERPRSEGAQTEAGMPQRPIALFTADERWLLLRPDGAEDLEALELQSLEVKHRLNLPHDPAAPVSAALDPEGPLWLRQRFRLQRVRVPELTPVGEAQRHHVDRYPALDLACDAAGELVSFAPLSQPWYDREDRGPLFGTLSARRQAKGGWALQAAHELYDELWFDGPADWDLRACGARVVGVYHHPKEWTRLVAVGFPGGVAWNIDLERRPEAFRVSPRGDAVWVAVGDALERHPLAWPESAEQAQRAERRRRLEELTARGGSAWAWEHVCDALEAIELSEELRAEIEHMKPRVAGWPGHNRVPPKSWAPGDPRLALTPLRRVAELDTIGVIALAELRAPGRQLVLDCFVREAKLLLQEGRARTTLVKARASGKGVVLTPGPLAVSADDRTLVAALHHADPLHYCEGSEVSPIGGGEQLLIVHDGQLVGHLKDDFKKVDEATDDRRHSAFALSADARTLFCWMLGGGQLSRLSLPGCDFERSVPWPRLLDMDLSPDGRLLAIADYPETHILDARTLEILLSVHVDGAPCPSARVCFDASGQHLAMVSAGPTRGALRRGATALTLRWHRLDDDGRASVELMRAPWILPGSSGLRVKDDPPRPTLQLARCGEEVRLLAAEERSSRLQVVELSTLRRAALDCIFHGFVAFDRSAEGVLLRLEEDVLRWSPSVQ